MARAKALVITGYGTNCEKESAYAVRQAGADEATIVHFSDIKAGRTPLTDFNFLFFPGGFLDGDDLGAAQAAATRWRHARARDGEPLLGQLKDFFEAGGVILGVCNGFQLLVKLGLLPGLDNRYFERQVTLSNNDSARFEDRWVTVQADPASPCVFTKGLDRLDLPIRHGEGKIIAESEAVLRRLETERLIALRYVHPDTLEPTQDYPYNPNGSPLAIAGLTDPTGRILGLMPHPEAFNHPTNHPAWTRGDVGRLGLDILRGGVDHLHSR